MSWVVYHPSWPFDGECLRTDNYNFSHFHMLTDLMHTLTTFLHVCRHSQDHTHTCIHKTRRHALNIHVLCLHLRVRACVCQVFGTLFLTPAFAIQVVSEREMGLWYYNRHDDFKSGNHHILNLKSLILEPFQLGKHRTKKKCVLFTTS